jgi:Leucine-rich repeat (LRR) protein
MADRAWKHWVIASILAVALGAAGSPRAEEKAQPKAFNSAVAFDVRAVIGGEDLLVGITPSERPLTIPPCQWWYVMPLPPVDMEKVRQEVEAQGIPGLELRDATDADLEHLKGLTQLDYLELPWKVTDAGLEHLQGLSGLQHLDLGETQVTDAGLEHLKGLTALQELNLGGTQVTDVGLVYLKGLTELQYLGLGGTKVTDPGLEHLKGLTALQGLGLSDTQVTDAGLVHLKGLTALQWLDLAFAQVTDAGVEQLKKSLPNVLVNR